MSIILGGLTFKLNPEKQIDFNGGRSITKLDIPGAPPKYQDMGEDEHTFAWSGVFEGEAAEADCKYVENLKSQGKEIRFIAGFINATVRIKEFNYSYIRNDYIRYSITLLEIQKKTNISAATAAKAKAYSSSSKKAGSSSSKENAYVIKKGDSLWQIALKYLGKGDLWTKIAKANNIKNPRKLIAGTKIKIPRG